MGSEEARVAGSYLQHLSDEDLRLLAAESPELGPKEALPGRVRAEPERVLALLERPGALALVFPSAEAAEPLLSASPFLIFAVAVHQTRIALAEANYVTEWLGPQKRTPVFEVADLREFLASPLRRLFLSELLASYTHISSGSVLVPTRRGMRRRRFSELDPVRLAEMLELVSEAERPGILRRLGDLSLFLTGVFPDHTATHGISVLERGRLLSTGRPRGRRQPAAPDPGLRGRERRRAARHARPPLVPPRLRLAAAPHPR